MKVTEGEGRFPCKNLAALSPRVRILNPTLSEGIGVAEALLFGEDKRSTNRYTSVTADLTKYCPSW